MVITWIYVNNSCFVSTVSFRPPHRIHLLSFDYTYYRMFMLALGTQLSCRSEAVA